jgi:exodeoxyribonuclease-3
VKLISWNVNGIRAVLKRGFIDFIAAEQPDVMCVQETKAAPTDVEPDCIQGYHAFWNAAQKKGYSGVLTLTREEPLSVSRGMAIVDHDNEGRVVTVELPEVYVVNVYVPNAKRDLSRLPYRQQWDIDFLTHLKKLEKKKPVIFCGDLNVAHTDLDLARPKANLKTHGFTAEERAGFSAFIEGGFIDTFRHFESAGGHYTWWRPMGDARARNLGWRIDYVLVSAALKPRLKAAPIYRDVLGSDHCPVGLELKPAKRG